MASGVARKTLRHPYSLNAKRTLQSPLDIEAIVSFVPFDHKMNLLIILLAIHPFLARLSHHCHLQLLSLVIVALRTICTEVEHLNIIKSLIIVTSLVEYSNFISGIHFFYFPGFV